MAELGFDPQSDDAPYAGVAQRELNSAISHPIPTVLIEDQYRTKEVVCGFAPDGQILIKKRGFKWRNTSLFDQKWCLMKTSSFFDQKMPEIVAKFDQILIKIDHPEQNRTLPL